MINVEGYDASHASGFEDFQLHPSLNLGAHRSSLTHFRGLVKQGNHSR
jgi:hypothetical protein